MITPLRYVYEPGCYTLLQVTRNAADLIPEAKSSAEPNNPGGTGTLSVCGEPFDFEIKEDGVLMVSGSMHNP